MNCFLCKGDMETKLVTHMVDLGNCIVIVRNVPAMTCTQCGEVWLDGLVVKQLEQIIDSVTAAAITEIAVVNYTDKVA